MSRTTTRDIRRMKSSGERIPMVTAYDYSAAQLAAQAGIPAILVGDSMGQTVLGHPDTLSVTVDDLVRATAAVKRGAPEALIIADMPFMSYQVSVADALRNAGRLIQEGGAQAVKLEGGRPVAGTIQALGDAGIAVMGHLGLTPQSVHKLGGYRVQGASASSARTLLDDALALEDAGVFAVVLELIPVELAEAVTERLSIPTIGIGSGIACDGQVQVWHYLLGLSMDFTPRHARRFMEAGALMRDALESYAAEVKAGRFPTEEQTVHAKEPLGLGAQEAPAGKGVARAASGAGETTNAATEGEARNAVAEAALRHESAELDRRREG